MLSAFPVGVDGGDFRGMSFRKSCSAIFILSQTIGSASYFYRLLLMGCNLPCVDSVSCGIVYYLSEQIANGDA